MVKFKCVFFVVVFLFVSKIISQEFPPINSFSTEEYGAENQNWDITQSDDNFIYLANNKGLLEYNGASWQLYETPNETIMRSVYAFKDKVYTGFYMGFGFWKKNQFGILEYHSIVKEQNVKMLEDEQVWSIVELDNWIVFRSLQRIYLYDLSNKSLKIINSESTINSISKVDGVIYFHQNGKGIYKIENGGAKLVSDNEILKNNLIVSVFKKDNKIHYLTQKNGFFYLKSNLSVKWKISADSFLKGKTIYSAQKLLDNSFAIGTISGGVFILNDKGELDYHINQSFGLSNNTVLSVFEDKSNNIWLGLDNGINCINNKSPFKIYNSNNAFLGTIYTSIVFKGNLYLGTNQGLFYKKINSKDSFKIVDNTQGQVWSLQEINGSLFCGHNLGTFLVENIKAKNIFNKSGTWTLLKINEETIIQGTYDGLYVLKKHNNQWVFNNKIEGFNNSSKYLVKLNENSFFVNHEYKGVFKLVIDDGLIKVEKVTKEQALEKSIHSSIVKYQNEILFSNRYGIYRYDINDENFIKDDVYSQLVTPSSFISASLVTNNSNNKLWYFSKDKITYLSPGKLSNVPEINEISISETLPKAASGYENLIHLRDDVYIIGTSNGYIQVDLNEVEEIADYEIYINKINSFETDEPRGSVDLKKDILLDFKENNLEFFFSVPNFSKTVSVKYQYQLIGLNKNWSLPTKSNTALFENLPYGSYKFKVRALFDGKVSSNESIFNFKVDRPWFLSNTLITFYVLLFLFSFYSVHIASKRYYKKQREELLDKAKKEAELKELESSKEIIKLNNDKLRSDIDSKNRELATSTMNIIKKNEFLSTVKTELAKQGNANVAKVIKIIDKNLNNTDDWKMFQEAFNNADKDFLKKVKEKHATLTPNDLRLCAYLRLNLSSKEIAPLLNISPRSVEVKRYRLRKKMELPHDANLTNYILEI